MICAQILGASSGFPLRCVFSLEWPGPACYSDTDALRSADSEEPAVTAGFRRLLKLLLLASGLGLVGVAVMTYLTWPANVLGNYVRDRQNHEANIRALTMRIEREADPLERRFYQAWLAEEKHDLPGAIQRFQSLRTDTQPGTNLHLRSSLRLGLAYGQNHQPEQELATYRALMDLYPGPSRLSQATFYLRQGDREHARVILDEALTQDDRDGSLGSDRKFARYLRTMVESTDRAGASAPR
jgi:tetratricopeptide (TPR) repeat protein